MLSSRGWCQVPLGVHSCHQPDGQISLQGAVFSLDGQQAVTGRVSGTTGVGRLLADELDKHGAAEVIKQVRATRLAEGHTY